MELIEKEFSLLKLTTSWLSMGQHVQILHFFFSSSSISQNLIPFWYQNLADLYQMLYNKVQIYQFWAEIVKRPCAFSQKLPYTYNNNSFSTSNDFHEIVKLRSRSRSSPGPFQVHSRSNSKSFQSIPIQNQMIWTRS